METKASFPIRLKILVTLLVVVTAVVSVITYAMAGMFHEDKRTYIHDLASLIAMSASEECRSVLAGYRDRLRMVGRVVTDPAIGREQRSALMSAHFEEFDGLVGLFLYEGERETTSAFDTAALQASGLSREDLRKDLASRPIPLDRLAEIGPVVENRTLAPGLPVLALAVPLDPQGRGKPRAVVGLIRLDGIAQIASRSHAFEVFIVDADGVLLAHRDPAKLRDRAAFPLPDGTRDLRFGAAVTKEFSDGATEMIGGFASPGLGGVTAGVRIPKSAAFLASREILNRLTTVALLLLVAAAAVGLVGSARITRPVERLVAATRKVGKGEFDIEVDVGPRDEIGALSVAFNQMAHELRARESALTETQRQLVQSEKMAAFGQLGAGIAHEVKNPLAGILGCAQLSLRKVEEGSRIHRNLTLIEKETRRCQDIVENLLRFARQEKAVLEPTDLNSVLADAAAIVNHQLELDRVKLVLEPSDEHPMVRGSSNQLQQVVVNLLVNAHQAMGERGGTVVAGTSRDPGGTVSIVVRDDGPGIPREIQAQIFEPFFTTKPGGKGTGLGLSVSYGIVKDHGGEILLESGSGRGAKFTLRFPAFSPETGARRREPAGVPA
ncbi:MAG: sensor histidine kinase [Candidatus Eiseniibacteriota bacterium]